MGILVHSIGRSLQTPKMWQNCVVTLLALAAILGTVQSQDPAGVQDGPCPNVEFQRGRNWARMTGTWHEQLRINSDLQPNQCPTTNTYGGSRPNITNVIGITNPDGSSFDVPREGVIEKGEPNLSLFSNDHPTPGFPDPNGLVFETIFTNYKNIHVFWVCSELENNKNIHYAWIESRSETLPQKQLNRWIKKLRRMGIDVDRFWPVGDEFCE